MRLVHLPVNVAAEDVSSLSELRAAVGWYRNVSQGRCHLEVHDLPPVHLSRSVEYYLPAGGTGSPPQNSQGLVAAALDTLDQPALDIVIHAQGRLLVSLDGAVKPHTWHLPRGGRSIGSGVWCHRYAVVPHLAPLGAVVHELGHLLFNWPDLDWERSLGEHCLMARGALRHEGHDPAPPCGPLLLREGWRTVVPVDNKTTVRQVALTTMGALRFGARQFLVERRCEQCGEHILVYTARSQNGILHPRLLGHIPIDSELEEKRILGAIAPLLRRFKARLVGVKS